LIGFAHTSFGDLVLQADVAVDSLVGTARVNVEVRLSPGRGGFGPGLGLAYESGTVNSPYGMGWSLSGLPSIGIDTRHRLPAYDSTDRFVFAGAGELVPVLRPQGTAWVPVTGPAPRPGWMIERYRTRVDRGFERFERWVHRASGRVHWRQRDRAGVVRVFGAAADGSTRIADPADPDRRVFTWLLEASYDPRGNAISYTYKAEDGAGVDRTVAAEAGRLGGAFAQRYLKEIRYGNSKPLSAEAPAGPANRWRLRVLLDYGEHGGAGEIPTVAAATPWPVRADGYSTYRPGFEVRTWRLCRRLLMVHDFPELGEPHVVGATELGHHEDPSGSMLERVGYRGYRVDLGSGEVTDRAVPPIELGYRRTGPDPGTGFEPAAGAGSLPAGLDGSAYQWVDLYGEGLPGVLAERDGGWYFGSGLGGGHFGPLQALDEVPAVPSSAYRLSDLDGDGSLDLVGYQGREAGSYRRDRHTDRWDGHRPFTGLPRVDFGGGRSQLVDLDGDGNADLSVALAGGPVWYPSEGRDGFGPAVGAAVAGPAGTTPAPVQDSRLGTLLADMNGDGLLDLVRIGDGRIEYHPNLGHGRFGPPVLMDDCPTIGGFGRFDPARVRLADLDRTGTADLIYLDDGEIRCWRNLSGNGFGSEQLLGRLPWIDRLATAQIGDFFGDGTICLIWSSALPADEGRAVRSLRLGGELPPRLLISLSNGAGRRSTLSWRSSAADYLRDRSADRPWTGRLPQHVMVVGRMDETDEIGGIAVTTRYEYHDGHFDDFDRRLVGFGQVDTYDAAETRPSGAAAERGAQPSLVRTWYLTGDPDRHAAGAYALDPAAPGLPGPVLHDAATLTAAEQLAAHRALAGLPWRSETYPVQADGRPGPHPYAVEMSNYRVRRLHPGTADGDAAFTVTQTETLRADYDMDADDPRVEHEVVLGLSPYGEVTRNARVAYARRAGRPGTVPEQRVTHAELFETDLVAVDEPGRYETGIPVEQRRWAVHEQLMAMRQQIHEEPKSEEWRHWHRQWRQQQAEIACEARQRLGIPEEAHDG